MKYLFLLFGVMIYVNLSAQPNTNTVDSLINWTHLHTKVDSEYVLTLHRISRRLSEKDVKKSFEYYNKVATLSDSLHFLYGKSLAQINLGLLYAGAGDLEESNIAFLKAIDESDACNSLRLKAISLENLGENFEQLRYYSKAKDYVKQAITINEKLKSFDGIANDFELLHRCDFDQDSIFEAKNDLTKGFRFAVKSRDSYAIAPYYIGFGKLFALEHNEDSAQSFFQHAMATAKEQDDLENEYKVYLAEVQYLPTLPKERKITFLDTALGIAKSINFLQGISEASKRLSQLLNNDRALYDYYNRIYIASTDSFYSQKNQRYAIIEESEWRLKNEQLENSRLKNIEDLQTKQITIKNQLLFVSVLSITFALLTFTFLYISIQNKKKKQTSVLKQQVAEAEANALRTQMEQLVKLQKIRSQIASDLHDDIGSSLSGIMIMSDLAKKKEEAYESYVDKIKQNAGNVIENMNDIVWAINPDNDTIDQLFIRMQNFAASLLEKKNIMLNFKLDDSVSSIKFSMDERKNFYLIFKEAIHNAFKYSDCKKVHVNIYCVDDYVVLKINDSGKGFNTESNSLGNGLKNMRKRAKEMNGKFEITSKVSGTCIKLSFKPTSMGR